MDGKRGVSVSILPSIVQTDDPTNHLEKLSAKLIDGYIAKLNTASSQLNFNDIAVFLELLLELRKNKNTIFVCGNGGSAANAIHIANDFTFGVNPNGEAISIEALPANSSVISCLANDIGYEHIYSHQLKVKARPGDLLLVLSGSGNSPNILNAIDIASSLEMKTVGILGYDGGKAKNMLDLPIHFDINDMQVSEDMQLVVGHILMKAMYSEINVDQ